MLSKKQLISKAFDSQADYLGGDTFREIAHSMVWDIIEIHKRNRNDSASTVMDFDWENELDEVIALVESGLRKDFKGNLSEAIAWARGEG